MNTGNAIYYPFVDEQPLPAPRIVHPPAEPCPHHVPEQQLPVPAGGGAASAAKPRRAARKRIVTTVKTDWRQRVAELIAERGLRGPFYEDVRIDEHTWTCAASAVHPVNGHTLHVLCSDTIKAPHPVHAPGLERAAQRLFEALDDRPTLFFDGV